MNVLLVNVDAKFNFAIRKLYAWYKQQPDVSVEMMDLNFPAYPHKKTKLIEDELYNRIYISNIYETNAYKVSTTGHAKVFYGGIGSREPSRKLSRDTVTSRQD